MTITKNQEGEKLTIALQGRLDTVTSPELESELKTALDGAKELIMDFTKLEYISSAGLRVLLSAHKKMDGKGGKMTVINPRADVMEIFTMTGLDAVFGIV